VSLSFRQVDAISPTPLRGNPGCGGEDAHEGTEGQVAALARGLAGAAPTGHDDEHPATFAFKVGQQAGVAATRSAHTWPGQATLHADERSIHRAPNPELSALSGWSGVATSGGCRATLAG
jgi:hypothetical protein